MAKLLFSYHRVVKPNNVFSQRFLSQITNCEANDTMQHIPVMLNETIKYLKPEEGQTFIDMTFGAGGHSHAILKTAKNCNIIALDRDPIGYENACILSKRYPQKITPLLGKFSELPDMLKGLNIKQNSIDGILFDFGCSSMQFDTPSRGFSLSAEGPLDMRMDGLRFPNELTAGDVLSRATEEDLVKIFRIYGEEKQCKKIARAIVEARYLFKKLETTYELAQLVESACGDEERVDKLKRPAHSATKVFQALRIFVNNELNEINYGMHLAQRYLKIGGRLITITFHSLEDTIVKRHISGNLVDGVANNLPQKYKDYSMFFEKEVLTTFMDSCWQSLTKHVILPSIREVDSNPRSRSAKLRAAIKIK